MAPTDGKIVIVCLEGDLYVKRIKKMGEVIYLIAENETYPAARILPHQDLDIWGTVTCIIHPL